MATIKSRLAQLLAQEDIKVQHLPTKTAYFDMEHRVLVCPIWKDMDGDLYDLCMGHEVGHALNTPAEGWHGALVQMGKGYQSYMNVVEDARIERKMKAKFPGLRAPFARAYIELDKRDLFKIRAKRLDINKLGLIDRLNIFFKMGHIYDVRFTEEERGFIDRINRAETWEQVREIADELYARAKKHKDKLPQTPQSGVPQECEDPQNSEDGEESENETTQSSKSKKDSKKQDKKDSKGKDDKKSKPGKSKKSKKDDSEKTPEELAEEYDNSNAGGPTEDDENEYDDEDSEGSASGDESDEDEDSEGDESGADSDAEDDGERSEEEETAANGGQGEDSDEDSDEDAEGSEAEGSPDGESSEDDIDSDLETNSDRMDDHDADDDDSQGGDRQDYIHNAENDQLPEVPDPTSVTDEAFRSAEESLVDQYSTGIRPLYLPDTKNVNDMIAPIDLIYTSIEDGVKKAFASHNSAYGVKEPLTLESFSEISVTEIIRDNKKYVDLLVKEFELRKNASEYARQLTAKTGELDVNRLHQYKFTNDLFRKITTVQKGKSHGMVFFLDMSSSMSGIMGYTVKQLLILVMFCKRVGVPFDVYGFADGACLGFRSARFEWSDETIQCADKQFHLKHLLSSSLRGSEFRRAFAALAMYSNIFYGQQSKAVNQYLVKNNRYGINFSEHDLNMILNGTPYNKMLLASRDIIEKFRNKHHVDIVNVIHLTDGDGTDHCHAPALNIDWNDVNFSQINNCRIAYTDRKTQISILANKHESSQQILTKLVKKITGCRHLAFYVGPMGTIKHYVQRASQENRAEAKKSLEQFGFFKTPHLGYDSYYYMAVDDFNQETEISNDENVDIAKRFIDAQRAKAKLRNMARQFATELAEQVKRND